MRRFMVSATGLAATVALCLMAGGAHAQASRTWVSGVGDDANPCSRTAPCKTWAGAISKTAAGGEIDALDPGGFGGLTITKSITIDGGGGQVASTLVQGTPGITIGAGAAVVTIRNLRINGLLQDTASSPGTNGISVASAAVVHIQNCYVFGFSQAAVSITPGTGATQVFVDDSYLSDNTNGLSLAPTGGALVQVLVRNTRANGNPSDGFVVNGAGGTAGLMLEKSKSDGNGAGLAVSGANGVAIISDSEFVLNGTGISVTGGGSVFTYQNNVVSANGLQISGPLSPLGLN